MTHDPGAVDRGDSKMTHDLGKASRAEKVNAIDAKREIPFELEYLDGKAWQVETYAHTPLSSCTPAQMERIRAVTGGERVLSLIHI